MQEALGHPQALRCSERWGHALPVGRWDISGATVPGCSPWRTNGGSIQRHESGQDVCTVQTECCVGVKCGDSVVSSSVDEEVIASALRPRGMTSVPSSIVTSPPSLEWKM